MDRQLPILFGRISLGHRISKLNRQHIEEVHGSVLAKCPPKTDRLPPSFIFVSGRNSFVASSTCGQFTAALVGHTSFPANSSDIAVHQQNPAAQVIHAYQEKGLSALRLLKGNWTLAIVDFKANTVFLAVDRLGIGRMCYREEAPYGISFSNSAELVSAFAQDTTAIDPSSVLKYFFYHCIPSPSTIFSGTKALSPAVCLSWSGSTKLKKYWEPDFVEDDSDNSKITRAGLFESVSTAVRSAGTGRGSLAAFLSGGLDSSTVVGFAARHFPDRINAYTIGFNEEGYDEVEYAKITAKHYDVPITIYDVTPEDVLAAHNILATAYDQPFGNSSAIPTYFCAKLAVDAGETTILAGDGGDEFFAGNERYRTQKLFEYYQSIPRGIRQSVLEPLFLKHWQDVSVMPIRKIRRYIQQALSPMPDRLQSYNFLIQNDLSDIFSQDFLHSVDAYAPMQHLRDVFHDAPTDNLINKMLFADWKITLADNDLRKVSTMCDYAGIDVRYPMLDEDLLDLSCKIPGNSKLTIRELRSFYRKSMKSFLPSETLAKRKHGFGLPFGPWFTSSKDLRNHMLDLIHDLRKRNILRTDYVDMIYKATMESHAGYYGEMIWLMATLENWIRNRPAYERYSI